MLITEAADRLRIAEEQGQPCEPIRNLIGDTDIDTAYAVQQHNIAAHIASGRRISGRKIGLTSTAVQQQIKVSEPDFGTLFADMEIGHGGLIPAGKLIAPRIEAEIMLVIGQDLNHECITFTDVLRATEFAAASLEVVDCRYHDWDIRITDTVADNAAAALYVAGSQPTLLKNIDLADSSMTLFRNGKQVSDGHGRWCMGHPVNAAVWLARQLFRRGTPLKSGDVILTGALGPMVTARPGDRFSAHIQNVGSVMAVFEE
ncbi:2-keto-4-pentenoate hydratase [Klebsiella sp. S69]|uniref:2-keto-4-pentenoate hydratase n=1 Tax=Klebsiella sp. S69 TaxID=2767439 RepID=UPI001907FC25|nr:fumarylacetoacetate hydrolase family protein [Klebsiella sp. S69]MBK0166802.1 fumarylacetoacetate hydrolase family protein [Klebsiella sp. S69]